MTERLDDSHIDAIMAHEVCHVARRDNLLASIHMFVEALFWFHPLVWWIGARLVDERERACDEDVIAMGSTPSAYAAGILKTCEFCLESPLVCVPGMTGSDLKKRIHDIVAVKRERLSLSKKLLLTAVGVFAIAGPLFVGTAVAPRLRAQQSITAPAQEFEVASVKPNKSGDSRNRRIYYPPGGRFEVINTPLRVLVRIAYPVQTFQIVGGPSWLDTDMFDIEARIGNLPASGRVPATQIQMMMRALLAERFKLVVHNETRPLEMYALVLARSDGKLGSQLKKAPLDCDELIDSGRALPPEVMRPEPGKPPLCGGMDGTGHNVANGRALLQLAIDLSSWVNRVVVDRTGLTGGFNWDLQWAPDQPRQYDRVGGPANPVELPATPAGVSVFTALEEQLGLKLESTKGPVDVLVIDHAEQPTPD